MGRDLTFFLPAGTVDFIYEKTVKSVQLFLNMIVV